MMFLIIFILFSYSYNLSSESFKLYLSSTIPEIYVLSLDNEEKSIDEDLFVNTSNEIIRSYNSKEITNIKTYYSFNGLVVNFKITYNFDFYSYQYNKEIKINEK
jgi:hypothetical protein